MKTSKIKDVAAYLNPLPSQLSESTANAGLIVGNPETGSHWHFGYTLTVREAAVQEAVKRNW